MCNGKIKSHIFLFPVNAMENGILGFITVQHL